MSPGAADALAHLRAACLALPEVNERLSHGSPTFFIRDKKTFVTFVDHHHGDGIMGIWCTAPPGVQEQLVEAEPERFFRPPGQSQTGSGLGLSIADTIARLHGLSIDLDNLPASENTPAGLRARIRMAATA